MHFFHRYNDEAVLLHACEIQTFSTDGSLEVCIVSFPLVSGSLHPVLLIFLHDPESVQGHKYPCH